MVLETSRPAEPSSDSLKYSSAGAPMAAVGWGRWGMVPGAVAVLGQICRLRAVGGWAVKGGVARDSSEWGF